MKTANFIASDSISEREGVHFEFMIVRGRLKLGKVVNPWRTAFEMILSLGWMWGKWYQRVSSEILLHSDDLHVRNCLKHKWFVIVPGFHFIAIYRLAKTVLQLEVNDDYRKTSPFVAGILALCPILAAIYLQNSLNHHWVQHAIRGTPNPAIFQHRMSQKQYLEFLLS